MRASPISTSPSAVGSSSSSASALRLGLGVVGAQLQLGEPQLVGRREQLVDPVPLRVHLEPVAGVRRDERSPPRVLLHAQAPPGRALQHLRNSSSSSATPTWSTRGSGHWPGWTTTLTAPRSSSLRRCRNPFCSSSSQETPASKCTWSSPTRP